MGTTFAPLTIFPFLHGLERDATSNCFVAEVTFMAFVDLVTLVLCLVFQLLAVSGKVSRISSSAPKPNMMYREFYIK